MAERSPPRRVSTPPNGIVAGVHFGESSSALLQFRATSARPYLVARLGTRVFPRTGRQAVWRRPWWSSPVVRCVQEQPINRSRFAMAESLGFEGHVAWAEAMTESGV
jgi:hypothetical protein